MIIRGYRPEDAERFTAMIYRYFNEDLHLPVSRQQAEEVAEDIVWETDFGVPLVVLEQENDLCGFADYQIDSPKSSWCFHPGWGCIREFYVLPEKRGSGCGRLLFETTARDLLRQGADTLYLTADEAIPFWQHMGFVRTGRICEKNGLEELEYRSLPPAEGKLAD